MDRSVTRATRNSRFVSASPEAVYAAFLDPEALAEWLPPGSMTGKVHAFERRVGGGYVMSLFYPEMEEARGKTAAREDRVHVRFLALEPGRRIVEAVTFETDQPSLQGEMTLTVTLTPAPGGTEVELLFENLPPGLRPEDNEEGGRLSLEQLARWLESKTG
ncbi:MAG: SRPBCC family protein [Proteobacteria bacterium]|nr:SRPBCC family protein [Pseudomonadota bacterium]